MMRALVALNGMMDQFQDWEGHSTVFWFFLLLIHHGAQKNKLGPVILKPIALTPPR